MSCGQRTDNGRSDFDDSPKARIGCAPQAQISHHTYGTCWTCKACLRQPTVEDPALGAKGEGDAGGDAAQQGLALVHFQLNLSTLRGLHTSTSQFVVSTFCGQGCVGEPQKWLMFG
jgi:hypothetical protein